MSDYVTRIARGRWTYSLFCLAIALLLFAGCASSAYKKLEKIREQGTPREVTESGLDCSEISHDCFKIKLTLAESYYQLHDYEHALGYSHHAVERLSNKVSLSDIYDLYVIRSRIFYREMINTADFANLDELKISLKIALESHERLYSERENPEDRQALQLQLAETLIRQINRYSGEKRTEVYRELQELIDTFNPKLKQQGYVRYYELRAAFEKIIPDVKMWMFKGSPGGEREEILEMLKMNYKDSLELRQFPLYQNPEYSARIEQHLSQLDRYMKQFIL